MTYKDEARASQSTRAARMIGSESDEAPRIAASENAKPVQNDKAVKVGDGRAVDGSMAKKRLDKPMRARGGAVKTGKGKTTVNVIVSPQGGAGPGAGAPPAAIMPPPMAAAPPMPLPPGGGAGGPPMPPPGGMPPRPPMAAPPGMPMRQRGGRVKMDAGAGGGKGRLEKIAL